MRPTRRASQQSTLGRSQPDGWALRSARFLGFVLRFGTPSLRAAVRFRTFFSPAAGIPLGKNTLGDDDANR
jgi:hypothetical protein